MKISLLSNRELFVLRKLSFGHSYDHLAMALNVSRACLHTICYHIRKKTGITSTRDVEQCREGLRVCSRRQFHKDGPTPRQIEVFRLLVQRMPYRQIGKLLGYPNPQTVQNIACLGAKRAGIKGAGYQRTRMIEAWLAKHDAEQGAADAMNDTVFN